MANFDELFDEVLLKVKSAADFTGKKTSEVVELGKLKYKAKQISWELERTYAKLGVIVYESRKGTNQFESVVDAAIEELDGLNKRLDDVEEKIRNFKKTERKRADDDDSGEVVDFEEIRHEDEE